MPRPDQRREGSLRLAVLLLALCACAVVVVWLAPRARPDSGAHWWTLTSGSLVMLLLVGLLLQEHRVRRRAEHLAAQMTSEIDRLALVARLTSNAVVITNVQRQITWVNEGFERLTAYSAAEAIGQTPAHLLQFSGTDPAELARMRTSLNLGQGHRCTLLNRGKHGRIYWVEIEIQPLHDRAGEFIGFMAIESDVTEQVHAQEALRASQDLLDKTGRIGSVGGWACELATGRMEWTTQTAVLLDLDVAPGLTLTPDQCLAFCTPQAREQVQAGMARGLDSGAALDVEVSLLTAKGRPIWVRLTAEFEQADGRAVHIVGALQDITARRAMQAEVERSAQVLRGAIDAIDEAFVLYDPEDRLLLCNDKYRAVYAQSADLIQVGARFEDIVRGGAERGQYQAAIGRVDAWVAERMAHHRAGNSTVVQRLDNGRVVRVLERRMPDGHLVGFRVDITDLVRATEAAEQASQAKSEFIATVSHELRTPLQSVIGFSELGEHFAQEQPSFRAMFADIHAGGQRMLKLVNDLLDISKFTGALVQLELRPEDLAEVCAAVVREFEPILAQRSVRIERPTPWPVLPVAINRFRMQQVLRNLLANAVRFSPSGSCIHLSLANHGDEGVALSVSDEGPGIPEDELDAIFEPFTQSSRTRDGSGGTGLGLTICRKIMTAHGGHIEAANAAGRGALITLRLPALAPTPPVPQVPQVPQDVPHETHHSDH